MADMTEYRDVELAGHTISVSKPNDGQLQALMRISQTITRAGEDGDLQFYAKQLYRVGTLLESLILPEQRELVEELFDTGQTDYGTLTRTILGAFASEPAGEVNNTVAAVKANTARVKRK
jgi:hypothetical protein